MSVRGLIGVAVLALVVALLIVVILFRPQGLLGRAEERTV